MLLDWRASLPSRDRSVSRARRTMSSLLPILAESIGYHDERCPYQASGPNTLATMGYLRGDGPLNLRARKSRQMVVSSRRTGERHEHNPAQSDDTGNTASSSVRRPIAPSRRASSAPVTLPDE